MLDFFCCLHNLQSAGSLFLNKVSLLPLSYCIKPSSPHNKCFIFSPKLSPLVSTEKNLKKIRAPLPQSSFCHGFKHVQGAMRLFPALLAHKKQIPLPLPTISITSSYIEDIRSTPIISDIEIQHANHSRYRATGLYSIPESPRIVLSLEFLFPKSGLLT